MVANRHERAPGAAAQQVPANDEQRDRPGEAEEIQPLIAVERQPIGGVGLADDDALHAARPLLEILEFENLRRRHRERKGGKREIVTLEPEGRAAKEKAGDEADGAGE